MENFELLDFLGTFDFLKLSNFDSKGNALTEQQKKTKIYNYIKNGVIPRKVITPVGRELKIIKDELAKHLYSRRGMKARQGI